MMNIRMFNAEDMRAYIRVKVEDRIFNDLDRDIRCEIDTRSFMNPHDIVWVKLDRTRIPFFRSVIKNRTKEDLKNII